MAKHIELFSTDNFVLVTPKHPHVTRVDGGHLTINPKVKVVDRTKLSPKLATELMKFTLVVGVAFAVAMKKRGVPLERINYQDNGNWALHTKQGPHLHIHIYGRAKKPVYQVSGEALYFPNQENSYYKHTEPLNGGDLRQLKVEIKKVLATPKYKNWI